MFIKFRIYALIAVLSASSLLSGCAIVASQIVKAVIHKPSRVSTIQSDTKYIAGLRPINSGPGLLVFEPVIGAQNQKCAAWSSGLTRWTQLYLGGQGEFGKTPTWAMTFELQKRFKLARKIGSLTGTSHILTSQISGKSPRLTWKLSLYELNPRPSKTRPLAAAWTLTGTPEQIQTEFPSIAQRIAQKLGAPHPNLPAKIDLTEGDLEFLSSLPLKPTYGHDLSTKQDTRLKKLIAKDALAGVIAQRLCAFGDVAWQNLGATLIKQAPQNAMVWREIGYHDAERLKPQQKTLQQLGQRYPDNFLLNQALMSLAAVKNNSQQEIGYAEKAVEAAPLNSLGWYYLAEAHADAADRIRQGRYASQVSSTEWQQIDVFYAKSGVAALRATQVDPQNTNAWSKLAMTATLNGNSLMAYDAIEKALALDPSNASAWHWGLQLTQPKWFGSRERFREFAMRAAQHANVYDFDASVLDNKRIGLSRPEIKEILEVAVKSNPRNVSALQKLGEQYHYYESNYPRAEQLYRQALAVDPDDGNANSALGDLTYWVHHDPKTAEVLYRKAIASSPQDGYFYGNLGRLLALTGRMQEAKAMAEKAKALGLGADHPVWAATGVSPN